ncbi:MULTISPECIES: hypothetical protein [unclassified Streptomyces]|uniref:hypothetical protein n=1 Tax=unclassified Streptomyces TaxID=2593676 RepID=UPI00339DC624
MKDNHDSPDREHRRPPGVSDTSVKALGALSKALETTERARGHLYSFHQLTGTADFQLDDAVALLRECGHDTLADQVQHDVLGRNVIPGHWTFQIIESYNTTYYEPFKNLELAIRQALVDGKDHLYEAELKEVRRTSGEPGHAARPDSPSAP